MHQNLDGILQVNAHQEYVYSQNSDTFQGPRKFINDIGTQPFFSYQIGLVKS